MKNKQKLSQLAAVTEFIVSSGNFALVKFEKTTHAALETLRKDLRKTGAVMKVIKNTIVIKAINKLTNTDHKPGFINLQKLIKGMRDNTAIISLGKEWSAGMNAFAKFMKTNQSLMFKMGYLDGESYDANRMEMISKLPNKGELLGRIIGSIKSPTSRLVYALKFSTQKFVMVLNAKAKNG